MKKIIFTSSLVMLSSFMYANANNTVELPTTKVSDEKISTVILDKNTVMEIRYNKNLDTCYARICKTASVTNSDGTIVEVKRCSDWEEVPCQPTHPQNPGTGIG